MKWVLLVYVLTVDIGIDLSVQREIEIETEKLCKQAQQRLIARVESENTGLNGVCIQVRE